MPIFYATNGDAFLVKQEDRSYGGKLTDVLKVDGNGVVTVSGLTISASGVVGSTGAVTATTGNFSGTLAVTGASTLTGNTGVTGTLTVTGASALNGGATSGGKTVATGSIFTVVHAGVDASGGAADVTLSGVLIGDQLVGAANLTTPGDVKADFAATVTVNDKLSQTSVDLSAKQVMFVFHRP